MDNEKNSSKEMDNNLSNDKVNVDIKPDVERNVTDIRLCSPVIECKCNCTVS